MYTIIILETQHKTNTKSPQKETQKKNEEKQPVFENPVKLQPKDGQNEQKRQLTQNRKQSQSQRKPRSRSKQKNIKQIINIYIIQNNIRNCSSKIIEIRKISTQLRYHQQYTPKLGICKNKNIQKYIYVKEPRNLIKLMNQCIKGNHHQAMPIQRINLPCKPKEITSKTKLRTCFQKVSQRIR
ncbi:Hypothetical_protein [Hexamita inflata]|uniref:Hypothetical_protein n=1 Tax=Hexamita inflata TaxID=28002 RepID=A0AA86TSP8_9EUKA|nr:Hypothetical protein HINF_LOCUS14866 [Hexamita inflata]